MFVRAISVLLILIPVKPSEHAAQQGEAGSIEGRVTVREAPRRAANRYPAGTAGATHALAEIPALVYVTGAAGAGRPAGAAVELAQKDTAFQPAIVVVPRGTAVRFPNRDPFFHNVFSYSRAKRFDLGRYPQGESKSVTFDEPGVVRVFCEVHKWMRAVVLVTDNPHHAVVGEDGRFSIVGVAPGRYRVTVWHPDRREQTREVTVPPRGAARLDVTL
jgi:plastocyanin